MQDFKFVNWRIRFLMSGKGYISDETTTYLIHEQDGICKPDFSNKKVSI